ncbi:hypothetical protein WI26_26125 [Burkholderia diffusa]|nr:hypothetical protein WI26_26125 [Burkholderia diffusa]
MPFDARGSRGRSDRGAARGVARIGRAAAGLRIGDGGTAATRAGCADRLRARPCRRWPASLCTIGRAR